MKCKENCTSRIAKRSVIITVLIAVILLVTIALESYCQGKTSPRVSTERDLQDRIFSISCKDVGEFKEKYAGELEIVADYFEAGIVWVKEKHDGIGLKEWEGDDNIVFIDVISSASVEAGTDYVNLAFNRITKSHQLFPDLTGESIKISVKEDAFDRHDIDLINRSFETLLTPTQTSQHATVIASLIAGAGNSSPNGLGVVPASRITSSDFSNLLPDPDLFFLENDIHLQNHSYGVEVENYYGNEAVAYDQQTFQNPDLLHVFSAGNSGTVVPDHGRYKGLNVANLSGTFKQSKNTLLVTAVDTTLNINPMNSRGPAYDGRLKPELTAFGQAGTSDAAALVTGVSAAIQHKYKAMSGVIPPSSLVKAVLIATADDLGVKGIDYTFGYGSVNAFRAVKLLENDQAAVVSLTSHDEVSIPIVIPEDVASIKLAVAWTDPAAVANSDIALVHNVDAFLTNGNDNFLPWILRTAPNADSLTAPATRGHDNLNNVEYISLDDPSPGPYQLIIKAAALTTPEQPVSIAYWIEHRIPFEWDYPLSEDILKAGAKQTLFWNSHAKDDGKLFYQLNDGPWLLISNQVDPAAHFQWTPPDTVAKARLKMVIYDAEFITDEFVISQDMKMRVAYNCDDEFLLTWNPVSRADSYDIYTLGDIYLHPVSNTTDTTLLISKPTANSYYAVVPVIDDKQAARSETIRYDNQGVSCYINFFIAERSDPDHVAVSLMLSTAWEVERIVIYRSVGEGEEVLIETSPAGTRYRWLDDGFHPGINAYRAEVTLKDGTRIMSETSEVLIEPKDGAVLFPNPLPQGELLNVLSEGSGLVITITDMTGRARHEQILQSTHENLNVENFAQGIYMYHLIRKGKLIGAGKLVKL